MLDIQFTCVDYVGEEGHFSTKTVRMLRLLFKSGYFYLFSLSNKKDQLRYRTYSGFCGRSRMVEQNPGCIQRLNRKGQHG